MARIKQRVLSRFEQKKPGADRAAWIEIVYLMFVQIANIDF